MSISPPIKRAEGPVVSFLAQLNALVEVLIKRGVFTREEFVEELASRNFLPLHESLQPLVDLLFRKRVINETDKREIIGPRQ